MQITLTTLLLAASAHAHYNFNKFIANGAADSSTFLHVRQPKNWQSNGYTADVTGVDIRCFQTGAKAKTATVAAGGTVGFQSNQAIFHPGPIQFYMAKVPEGQSVENWSGEGEVWFKTSTSKPSGSLSQWPSDNKSSFSFTIPKNTPSGDYLVRIEHIGLHAAGQAGGAQFYIACGQVTVTGGGSGTPGPLVAFPGAYSASDPGIKINIYGGGGTYKAPGPAVWSG